MITNKIAMLYAKALFKLMDAEDKDTTYSLLSNLEQFVSIVINEAAIRRFFFSPEVSQKHKEQVIKEKFSGYCEPLLISFFLVLLQRRRFIYLPQIVEEYRSMVDNKFGIIQGRLTTSQPVDAEAKKKLEEKWQKLYDKKLELLEEIDPSLIGGGTLMVANHLIDFSIKGRLNKLKKSLLAISIT